MKLAVLIATYNRKNGSTSNFLNRSLTNLSNQTYKNFKVVIVGDDYENEKELYSIVNQYKDKLDIHVFNNKYSCRKNVFKLKGNLWSNGGIYAIYEGMKYIFDQEFDYYFQLDDDDIWTRKHIENYVWVFNKFPEASFIYSKAKYKNTILPKNVPHNIEIKLNNFQQGVKGGNVVHSSFAFKISACKKILLQLYQDRITQIDAIKTNKIKEYMLPPHDAIQLRYMHSLNSSILIPQCTVQKESDLNIPMI